VSVTYEVATPVYDGPFDLLLHLILKEEVDIHEISLLTIVEAYLAEVSKMETLDLEVATEFLLIAATLVELKTRRLLPSRENVTCCCPGCSIARRSRTLPGCFPPSSSVLRFRFLVAADQTNGSPS
jgi:hypothetical protein